MSVSLLGFSEYSKQELLSFLLLIETILLEESCGDWILGYAGGWFQGAVNGEILLSHTEN